MLEKIRAAMAIVALVVALLSFGMSYQGQAGDTLERPAISYEIVGICSTSQVNTYEYAVMPEAFDRAIARVAEGDYIPLLLNHDNNTSSIIGKITFLKSSLEGILFRAHITASKTNRDVINLIRNGYLVGVSVGFSPIEQEGATITRLKLYEISLVGLASDPGAHIISIKELP